MEKILVAGQELELFPMDNSHMKGVFIDAVLMYDFYETAFNGESFCLLVQKKEGNSTPLSYKLMADRLEKIISMPIVFLFDKLEFYQRNRLIERGVFFIVSDKYAYLPYLIVNAKETAQKNEKSLTAATQYLLFFHLQEKNLQGLTLKDIEESTPYKYVTISRAVAGLEQFRLCHTEKDERKNKRIFFEEKLQLWEAARQYLINPIQKVVYCDGLKSGKYAVCGENALAHYTNLNPASQKMYAIEENMFRKDKALKNFEGLNDIEGDVKIEVWKYPPMGDGFVDKLSLYLTLKDDKDPRIEKELEKMMKKLW